MNDLYLYIGIGAFGLLIVIITLFLIVRNKKKNTKKVKPISIEFLDRLRLALGADNLVDVKAEHERVKFYIKDLKKVDLNGMKALSYKGVFIKSNEVTATFEYAPVDIIKSLKQ